MSTIEKIFQSLQLSSNDKKATLTNSYKEKSVWLKKEFDLIRQLIEGNPRENALLDKPERKGATLSIVSSSEPVAQIDVSRKRRSSEIVNDSKFQKRTDIEMPDLILQAGLPSDLNKMKKEQLLVELEKRGNTQFSMKNVKTALIDALKDTLLSEHQNRHAPKQLIVQNAETNSVEAESTDMVMSTPSKPSKPAMRGSLMADFRSQVRNSITSNNVVSGVAEKPTTEEEQKERVKNEYNARMHRQRESVAARQSILHADTAVPATAVAEEKVEVIPSAPALLAAAPAPASSPVPSFDAPTNTTSKDSIGSTTSEVSIWMEVSSPVRTSAAEATTANTDTAEEVPRPDEAQHSAAAVDNASSVRPRAESDASFQSCASTGSNVPKSTLSSSATTTSAKSSTSSHSSVRPVASKMSAHHEKMPVVTKPALPTFTKTKLGSKPVEESRTAAAVLTKKAALPENKPASAKIATASTSAPAQSVRPATAPIAAAAPAALAVAPVVVVPIAPAPVVVVPIAPAPVVVVPIAPAPAVVAPTPVAAAPVPAADSAATANAAPAKRGIFGFLSNSKKNITSTPTTTTTAAAPGAAPLSNSGLFSPSAQSASSAKSAAPAMVDSIIKSAKLDTVAAPFSTSTSTPSAPRPVASEREVVVNESHSVEVPVTVASSVPDSNRLPVLAPEHERAVLKDITAALQASDGQSTVAASPLPDSPPVSETAGPTATATTEVPAPVAVDEYVMSDREDSGEEEEEGGGTDTEGEGEKEGEQGSGEEGEGGTKKPKKSKQPKKNIPDWARGQPLKDALMRQYGLTGAPPVDPDAIFPDPVQTCSLEEIFGAREGLSRKYAVRSSSAHWDADQMTLVEKRVYRKHMGY